MNSISADTRLADRPSDSSFKEKNFSDLIDEEKRGFVCRRLCQTFFGGYRLMYDEDHYAPWFLHLY